MCWRPTYMMGIIICHGVNLPTCLCVPVPYSPTNRWIPPQWFIYNFGLMGPGTRCFLYQWVPVANLWVQNTIFFIISLQYHCTLGLAEIKTLHARDKIMSKRCRMRRWNITTTLLPNLLPTLVPSITINHHTLSLCLSIQCIWLFSMPRCWLCRFWFSAQLANNCNHIIMLTGSYLCREGSNLCREGHHPLFIILKNHTLI